MAYALRAHTAVRASDVETGSECARCGLNTHCFTQRSHDHSPNSIEHLVQHLYPLRAGADIYCQGAADVAVYIVRSGSVKSVQLMPNGSEHVAGFFFPGDWFGMDAIACGRHINFAVALETSSVCRLSLGELTRSGRQTSTVLPKLFRAMSRQIVRSQLQVSLLRSCSTEQRLASFLLSISRRKHRQKQSAEQFQLSMSRGDISNYLGMKPETLCRAYAKLREAGALDARRADVRILDMAKLGEIAGPGHELADEMSTVGPQSVS